MLVEMKAVDDKRTIEFTEYDLEYLGDVGEFFLNFLRGIGYSYVKQVVIVKDDNTELATAL